MAGTEIQITEGDLSEVLRLKVNEVTNLQVQLVAMTRAVTERNERIDDLEARLASLNGKEAVDADSGDRQEKEKVSVH
jgi:hypothetical protein